MDRDVSKIWLENGIQLSLFGIENQTAQDKTMPLRIIGYDGASYREQLLKNQSGLYPVVTMVLYFGYKHWNTSTTLHKSLTQLPDGLKPYVSDYKINVFEIAYLSQEQVKMFKSDFRIVAEYFVQTRTNPDYRPVPERIRYVNEMLNLMSVLTSDQRFESNYIQKELSKKEVVTMCEVLDLIEARGEARGELKGKLKMIKKCY